MRRRVAERRFGGSVGMRPDRSARARVVAKPRALRHSPWHMSKRFYITTAIDYVNGQPHLGHAYEKVITDVIARVRRSMGEDVFFLTGLDEHGQKVQQAAAAAGQDAQAYCDGLAVSWEALTGKLQLTNNDFIRTTDARHKQVVQAILTKLHAEGHFYQAEHRGFYSARQETFLTEKDRLPDGTFDPIYGDVVELVENNYYFRLQAHQQWLIDHIEAHPGFIQPSYRRNEILGFLRNETLEDLCISRPRARLAWGIPLPFDAEFVTYVWFDALVNYVTVPAAHGDPVVLAALGKSYSPPVPESLSENAAGSTGHRPVVLGDPPSATCETLDGTLPAPVSRRPSSHLPFGGSPNGTGESPVPLMEHPPLSLWPADAHVIGKDILKFHSVFWPIMLKAIGLPLPKQILAHGWWQKDGQKMSKTTGNVVDPVAIIDDWGVDAFRFYVTRELDLGPDGNWTDAGFQSRYAAELANGLGNLVNRSLSMLGRYRSGIVPARSNELADEATRWIREVSAHLQNFHLQAALQSIWSLVNRANQYVDQTAPFKLAKDPAQAARLDEVLYNLTEACRILAVLLWPFIPGTSEKIHAQLGLTEGAGCWRNAAWGGLVAGHQIGTPAPLFPRRDQPGEKK